MKKNENIKTLDEFIDKEFGKVGTESRNDFERGFEEFKVGFYYNRPGLKKDLPNKNLQINVEQTKVTSLKLRTILKKSDYRLLERL